MLLTNLLMTNLFTISIDFAYGNRRAVIQPTSWLAHDLPKEIVAEMIEGGRKVSPKIDMITFNCWDSHMDVCTFF